MRSILLATAVSVALAVGEATEPRAQAPAASSASVLWFPAPAANWNEALPVANGRLAAMVFGGVRDERLQLNEDSVWAGEKTRSRESEGGSVTTGDSPAAVRRKTGGS